MYAGRKALAFIVRDFREETSYKVYFLQQIGSILIPLLTFFYLSKLFEDAVVIALEPYGGSLFAFSHVAYNRHDSFIEDGHHAAFIIGLFAIDGNIIFKNLKLSCSRLWKQNTHLFLRTSEAKRKSITILRMS